MPPARTLQAPASWRSADFISDLHLDEGEPATFEAWRRYMRTTPADAIFILGDLFEAWVGDDAASQPGFAADCLGVMAEAAQRLPVHFMHGNRDFLVGESFLSRAGVTLLADPTLLEFAGGRWLLTHGDALCLDDTEYLAFRSQVRSPTWQEAFLARPLAERQAIGRQLREQSEARKHSGVPYADVDTAAALECLKDADARVMIHGHTHRPASHDLADGCTRIVLSDWDAAASPPRAQALRVSAAGVQRIELA